MVLGDRHGGGRDGAGRHHGLWWRREAGQGHGRRSDHDRRPVGGPGHDHTWLPGPRARRVRSLGGGGRPGCPRQQPHHAQVPGVGAQLPQQRGRGPDECPGVAAQHPGGFREHGRRPGRSEGHGHAAPDDAGRVRRRRRHARFVRTGEVPAGLPTVVRRCNPRRSQRPQSDPLGPRRRWVSSSGTAEPAGGMQTVKAIAATFASFVVVVVLASAAHASTADSGSTGSNGDGLVYAAPGGSQINLSDTLTGSDGTQPVGGGGGVGVGPLVQLTAAQNCSAMAQALLVSSTPAEFAAATQPGGAIYNCLNPANAAPIPVPTPAQLALEWAQTVALPSPSLRVQPGYAVTGMVAYLETANVDPLTASVADPFL